MRKWVSGVCLLFWLAVSSNCLALPLRLILPENNTEYKNISLLESISSRFVVPLPYTPGYKPLDKIKEIIQKPTTKPSHAVVGKVLKTIECARAYNLEQNNILTIIDYSLPSSEKRLWIYDLDKETLLFNTYVSHGINSGAHLTEYFSNRNNSKASSFGVFNTEKAYYGRHGLSLRLAGLDKSFNDNAARRSVVMHGGWYVEENFIKRYGRAGRSWGCPAVPTELTKPIIETIKDKSFLVVYYPNENWFAQSKFLNCTNPNTYPLTTKPVEVKTPDENRENILFTDMNENNHREENESILVMDANNYERTFQIKAPLERMLRRQINNMEYIALSDNEFSLLLNTASTTTPEKTPLDTIYFVIPEVKMNRGYYATEMKIVNLGKIKEAKPVNYESKSEFTVQLEPNRTVTVKTANHFIRWLGL